MKPVVFQFIFISIFCFSNQKQTESLDVSIQDKLPAWFLKTNLMKGNTFNNDYLFEKNFNPYYLESDFNGDHEMDIAIPITEIKSEKKGFAIVHGKTNRVFIIGAGSMTKNALSDDMSYIDVWKINTNKVNEPGIDEDKPLILKNNSLEILKSEAGGGIIFWNGNTYEYFHQSC